MQVVCKDAKPVRVDVCLASGIADGDGERDPKVVVVVDDAVNRYAVSSAALSSATPVDGQQSVA